MGTIGIRRHSKRTRVRMIKVRRDGPRGRRWIALARHWWLENRGAIPPGMRVVHFDGDVLNDDPTNYRLVTPGDVAYLARVWDPTLDARNARAVSVATAACNRERARVNRALRFLPRHWYGVDPAECIVINEPFRSRVELYRRHVDPTAAAPNGKGLSAAWLGWPGLPGIDACVLAVLADAGPSELPAIRCAVRELRDLHGWQPAAPLAGTFITSVSRLRQGGFIRSVRVPGRRRREYQVTPAGITRRSTPCPVVAARGKEIGVRFPGFRKVWPELLTAESGDPVPAKEGTLQ